MLRTINLAKTILPMLALFGAASTLFLIHDQRGGAIVGDSLNYLYSSANLVEGRGYTFFGEPEILFPPGYGLATMPFYLAGFKLGQAAILVNVFALAAACFFLYRSCRFYVEPRFAYAAALLLAVNAYVMTYLVLALTEMLFMSLIAGGTYLVLRFVHEEPGGVWNLIAAGLLLGWASLTRPEGIAVAGALFVFVLLSAWLRERPLGPLVGIAAGAMLLPVVAVYAPYAAYLSLEVGHFTLTEKGDLNILVGNVATDPGAINAYLQKDLALEREEASSLSDHVRRTSTNLVSYSKYFVKQGLPALSIAGLLFGPWLYRRRWTWDRKVLEVATLSILGLATILPMAYFIAHPRLFVPFNVFLIFGALVLAGRLFAPGVSSRIIFAAIALSVVVVGISSHYLVGRHDFQEIPLQRAADVLAASEEAGPIDVVTLRRAAMTSYYANNRELIPDAEAVSIGPEQTAEEVVQWMVSKGFDYLILDAGFIATRPALTDLWECEISACPSGLRLVYEERGVYRIFRPTTPASP